MLGTYVLSAGYYDAYYLKAQQVRTLIRRDYDRAFEQVDVIAMPTSPTPAFALGERTDDPRPDVPGGRLHRRRQPGRTAGDQRAVRLDDRGLPIGLQFTGRAMEDATVLRVAHGYERATTWSSERPPRTTSELSR